jgi:uncharacterized protein DUF4255
VLADRLQRLFFDVPVLKGDLLVGSLPATGNTRISIVPEEPTPEMVHNIWGGFPHKAYRLTLFYLLTPVRLPSDRQVPAHRVLDVELQVDAGHRP